jgi:hypothetical protein
MHLQVFIPKRFNILFRCVECGVVNGEHAVGLGRHDGAENVLPRAVGLLPEQEIQEGELVDVVSQPHVTILLKIENKTFIGHLLVVIHLWFIRCIVLQGIVFPSSCSHLMHQTW